MTIPLPETIHSVVASSTKDPGAPLDIFTPRGHAKVYVPAWGGGYFDLCVIQIHVLSLIKVL